MFPYEDDELLDSEEEIDETPEEYGLNYEDTTLTGIKVSGVEALKVWAHNALTTPRYRYEIFSDDYGSELFDLISWSNSPEYIESEARRMVEECVTVHPAITGISDFVARYDGDRLELSFTLETEYGSEDMEEMLNV